MNIRQNFTPTEQAFREFMRTQKCPFRIREGHQVGERGQEMMSCDPDCVALIFSSEGKSVSYGCLRLTQNKIELDSIDPFIWEEEYNAGE